MPAQAPGLRRELGLRDVVLFNIAAVVSIRWLATAAHIGPGSLLLWAGAALLFFVPLALAVAALTAAQPAEGGIYAWTGHAFGEWHGFLCGWCYWLSNLFYFPNLLVSGIGIAIYTLGSEYAALSESRLAVVPAALILLWLALLTNLVGLRVGKWTQNLGASATCLAGVLLIAAGAIVLFRRGPATPLAALPSFDWTSLNFWPQIAFAFGGLELGAILCGEIRDPARTVRRAAWISALAIAGFYVAGTLAILVLLPPERVSVVTGLGQASEAAALSLGIPWIGAALAALIALGVMGQFGAWAGGSARLAFAIGLDRYFPASFARLHPRWRTPHVALLTQGAACTLFLALMQSGEDLRTAYQLLVDMTVITYFIPFVYMFAAAWKHGLRVSAAAGLLVTLTGISFSFVPTAGASSIWIFEAKLAGSCLVLIALGRILYVRGRSRARG